MKRADPLIWMNAFILHPEKWPNNVDILSQISMLNYSDASKLDMEKEPTWILVGTKEQKFWL